MVLGVLMEMMLAVVAVVVLDRRWYRRIFLKIGHVVQPVHVVVIIFLKWLVLAALFSGKSGLCQAVKFVLL